MAVLASLLMSIHARAKNILNWFQMWAETVLGVFCLEILSELLSLHVEE